ncbi:DUF2530 domain-containing protein [Actinocorallia sp. B10E7]|uniref:DUF2530 domain-containing protein n=1 Tax=Actinocorallia sp. B10E7 TaxID=3153558 RepID=UPI00325E4D7D
MPTHPRRPQPEPLKTNDVHTAIAGTVVWTVALLVLLVIGLPEDQRWWLWVCMTGAAIGVFACWFIPRMQRTRAAEEARAVEGARTAEETPATREARSGREGGDGTGGRPPLS